MKFAPRLIAISFLFAAITLGETLQASTIYVSNDNNTIQKYAADGTPLGTFANTGMNGPNGIAFDAAGNLYVANFDGNTVEKYSPTGQDLGVFASIGMNAPSGIAFDAVGNLYVSEFQSDVINQYNSAGLLIGSLVSPFVHAPSGLAFDPFGTLYVASEGNNRIERFLPIFAGGGIDLGTFVSTGLNEPVGLAFDSSGNLYAANLLDIHKFSSGANDLGSFTTSNLNKPLGIVFDSSGNLYVANNGSNSIEKYSATGVDLGVFAGGGGLSGPQFFALGPDQPGTVPEAGPTILFLSISLAAILAMRRIFSGSCAGC